MGGGGKPPSEPPPTPRPAEKSWSISAADFGDDEPTLTGAASSRSAPYAWERIIGGNVRVSIGGHDLPFTSASAKPVFVSDISGAEWTVAAEVRAGAVVLVLTAPDQTENAGFVETVTITNPGNGYTATPTVTFSAPPAGGTPATGTAAGPGSVASVTITEAGSGYTAAPTVTLSGGGGSSGAAIAVLQSGVATVMITTEGAYSSVPTVTFAAPPSGGATATGTVHTLGLPRRVSGVTITNAGSGYTSVPTVTFSPAPADGTTAAGTAVLQSGVASAPVTNGGSGYTAAPTVTFGAAPGGGTTATGTAVLQTGVTSVTVTNRGSGYELAPTVTFSAPASGTRATATAKLAETGNNQYQNLYWARQTLAGKQLLVRLAE